MVERGCLVPVILQVTGNGDYRHVDGEKRYKAAVLGALMELPAIIRPVGAGDDIAELEAELLVDALVANQHRSPLSLVEQALACRRLKVDHGLTIKGIAQKLQLKQARVKERLALLDLPEVLWPRIAAGEISANAIAPLLAVAKIHPGWPGSPSRSCSIAATSTTPSRGRGAASPKTRFALSPAVCTTRPSTRPPACSSRDPVTVSAPVKRTARRRAHAGGARPDGGQRAPAGAWRRPGRGCWSRRRRSSSAGDTARVPTAR